MNGKIKTHIKNYCENRGYTCNSVNDIHETLTECGNEIYRETVGERRWWNDVFIVVDLEGMLIGFSDAETTGDSNPSELGWEFNTSSICEVVRKEETKVIITYNPKPEK